MGALHHAFPTVYLLLSLSGLYLMRYTSAGLVAQMHLEPLLSSNKPFRYPGTPQYVRRCYTGIGPVDTFMTVLVTVFLAGTGPGFVEKVRVQQIGFLGNVGPVVAVMSIESVRGRGLITL
jgi:hypothetical protein